MYKFLLVLFAIIVSALAAPQFGGFGGFGGGGYGGYPGGYGGHGGYGGKFWIEKSRWKYFINLNFL